eukprot:COSAG02_NODE_14210_length_1297_cov_0.964942_4_plen_66_part_01
MPNRLYTFLDLVALPRLTQSTLRVCGIRLSPLSTDRLNASLLDNWFFLSDARIAYSECLFLTPTNV